MALRRIRQPAGIADASVQHRPSPRLPVADIPVIGDRARRTLRRNIRAAPSGHDQQRGGVREVRAGVDLNAVTGYTPAPDADWRDGDAWLGGGTWLFSQPQPRLRRLLDLRAFGWPPLTETDDGLSIAATCTLAELARWRPARQD